MRLSGNVQVMFTGRNRHFALRPWSVEQNVAAFPTVLKLMVSLKFPKIISFYLSMHNTLEFMSTDNMKLEVGTLSSKVTSSKLEVESQRLDVRS